MMAAATAVVGTPSAEAQTRPAQGVTRAANVAPAITVPLIDYTARTLPNGLKVYALRDPSTATVSVQMWYDVGAKDDPEGRSGFAHLFEHILSRVTRNIAPGQLSQIVEDAGGTRNASTGADFTNYFETVPANQLEAMLWAHAERMGKSVLDQSVFEAERNIVKEELRQRVLAEPYGRLQRFVMIENSFESHPYKRPGIGSIEHLDSAKLEDARAFHENFYRPDNATLIVAGNFDPAQLNRWVDEHFGSIQRPNKPILRFKARETQRAAPRSVTSYAPNVPLPAVAFSWQTPSLSHADMPALTVLDTILSGGESSRLYRSLVYDKQLAQSANSYNYALEEAGFFAATVTVASGKSPDDALAALNTEVARLRDQPVSAEELAEAKTEYLAGELFERETAQGRAFALGPLDRDHRRSEERRQASAGDRPGHRGGRSAGRASVPARRPAGDDPLPRRVRQARTAGVERNAAAEGPAGPHPAAGDPHAEPTRAGGRAHGASRPDGPAPVRGSEVLRAAAAQRA
jgi:zinc protease